MGWRYFNSLLCFFLLNVCAYAQVAINKTGAAPDASSMLDIQATDAGLLIPRIALTSNTDVLTIASPTTGLMIYNTATVSSGSTSVNPGFYFHNGSKWVRIDVSVSLEDSDSDTKIQVEESADEDKIHFDIGGVEYFVMDSGRIEEKNTGGYILIGQGAGLEVNYAQPWKRSIAIGDSALSGLTPGGRNIAIGHKALRVSQGWSNVAVGTFAMPNHLTGAGNTAVGDYALNADLSGDKNSAFGAYSMEFNQSGVNNSALGYYSLGEGVSGSNNVGVGMWAIRANKSGGNNVAVGNSTLWRDTLSQRNVAIGHQAGEGQTNGNKSNNVFIGYQSAFTSKTGTGNIFLGYQSGYNELGNNKLYIENSNADSANALIYGEFDNNILAINGNLGLGTQSPQAKLEIKQGVLALDIDTIAIDDVTPDVSTANTFLTSANTVATEITDLDNVVAGQQVTIICGSSTNASTITDAGNFSLTSDWTPGVNDVIILLVLADNNYIELSRVDN